MRGGCVPCGSFVSLPWMLPKPSLFCRCFFRLTGLQGLPLRFGASTVMLSPEGWESGLGTLAEAGVEVVEFCAEFGPDSREVATFDYTDPYAVERAAAALYENGLALHSIHAPIFLRQATEDTENTEGERYGGRQGRAEPLPSVTSVRSVAGRSLDGLIQSHFACIDACAALGGRFVVTQDMAEELPPEEPHLASREALSRLADYAADHGCVFAIENGAEDPQGFERLAETVHALAHPGLGICLDLGHAQVWGHRDVPRAVREAGRALRDLGLMTCHVHDNLGVSDDHLPPGDGVIPWAAVLREFALAGYQGPLVLELHSGGQAREVTELLTRSMEFLASFTNTNTTETRRHGGRLS